MAEKLVGQNYETPDIRAKVTGRARYSEDFRAPGMLFARLLLSRYAYEKIRSIDTSDALAMPGVKAILLPEDVPGPKIRSTTWGRRFVPIRTASARSRPSRSTRANLCSRCVRLTKRRRPKRSSRSRSSWDVLPYNVDPVATLRRGAATARVEGNVWVRPTPTPGQPPPLPEIKDLKWTDEQFAEFNEGRLPMGESTDPVWSFGDVDAGFLKAGLVLDVFVLRRASAEVEVDVETGVYRSSSTTIAVADVGTVIQPAHARRASCSERFDSRHRPCNGSRVGSTISATACRSRNGSIRTSRRRFSTFRRRWSWSAVELAGS